EPRGAQQDGADRRGPLLVALAPEALAQGRGFGPRAEGEVDPDRLRRGHDTAGGRAGGRHCVPHRASFVLLPEARRIGGAGGRPRPQGSQGHLRRMSDADTLQRLGETTAARRGADPASSYVASLFAKGGDAVMKKLAEEAAETLLAAKDGDKLHIVRETA